MLFLVKLFPEITIKSRPVRKRFIRQLRKNLKLVLKPIDDSTEVRGDWDSLEVEITSDDSSTATQIIEKLCCTPGIGQFAEVAKFDLPDMEGILDLALEFHGEALKGKTFAVRCKRMGSHPFSSVDVERFVGAGLNQNTAAAKVKLVNPDVTVAMEIREDKLFMVKQVHQGLGGFPLGCQDSVLSLISGGFDSAVSSYLCIKRGLQTHYCFFNLGGKAHEIAVKEVALFLWMKYHSSHRVKFITVPFEGVVEEILNRIDDAQMGVVLKRMMLRAANQVASRLDVKALVTGESVAQVSSQTLTNLSVIDTVSDALVLRPLATTDKQEIIDTARTIGTEEFSKHIPEYCAVISKNPTTKAREERIGKEEEHFNFAVLEASVAEAREQLITEVVNEIGAETPDIDIVAEITADATVIDIRHPNEADIKPLHFNGSAQQVLNIPFYALRTRFNELDSDGHYLLYCDHGMMSRLHAAHLLDEGFTNIAVLDPKALKQ
ncbi:MAG: tRNA 4-thiouridine(8) synthase ThiI [Pseudomonadales bacterium]|nr:tRNA 4-thiouridine(8) synthase ThiI [Pseudomonadales bacterium]